MRVPLALRVKSNVAPGTSTLPLVTLLGLNEHAALAPTTKQATARQPITRVRGDISINTVIRYVNMRKIRAECFAMAVQGCPLGPLGGSGRDGSHPRESGPWFRPFFLCWPTRASRKNELGRDRQLTLRYYRGVQTPDLLVKDVDMVKNVQGPYPCHGLDMCSEFFLFYP